MTAARSPGSATGPAKSTEIRDARLLIARSSSAGPLRGCPSVHATLEVLPIDDRTVDLPLGDQLPGVIDGSHAEGHSTVRGCRRLGGDVDASAQRRRAAMRNPLRDSNRRVACVEEWGGSLDG